MKEEDSILNCTDIGDFSSNCADYDDEYNDTRFIQKLAKFGYKNLIQNQDKHQQHNTNPISKRVQQMTIVQQEALQLFSKKNQDYGDSFATYGSVGVIVRIGDKIQRLLSVSKNGVGLVSNESLRDTLIDLHNYAAMAVMLIDES
jgi:hypothetical protein